MQKIKEKLARNELVRMIGVGRLMQHNFIQILGIQGGFAFGLLPGPYRSFWRARP